MPLGHASTLVQYCGRPGTRAQGPTGEQSPQAHLWPHGTAACDLGLTKQTMHVVWPPMVDSGTARRPVSNCAAASDITGSDGNLSSVSAALQQPSPPPQPQQPSPLPQQHPAPPSPQRPSPRPSLWPFLQQQPSQPCLLPQQREPLPPHWHSQQRPGQRPQPLQPCSWLLPRQPSLRSCPPALRPGVGGLRRRACLPPPPSFRRFLLWPAHLLGPRSGWGSPPRVDQVSKQRASNGSQENVGAEVVQRVS